MKTNRSSIICAALGAVSLLTMTLQAESWVEVAKVPFAFQVSGKTMPAGNYRFEDASNGAMSYIRNLQTGRAVYVTATSSDSGSGRASIRFHLYGSEIFLADIRTESGVSHSVPVCAREKELKSGPKAIAMTVITVPVRAD